MSSQRKRDRGRILTDEGYKRIWVAVCQQFPDRQTFAAIAKWTEPEGENPNAVSYITAETISTILNRRNGVDRKSIEHLFQAFGLTLQESDHKSYSDGSATRQDPNFVGREEAIADLNMLVNRGARMIVIQARGGVGKTTLARKYLQQEFDSFLEFPIAKETKDIASIEGLVEEKLRQLGEEPGREFLVSLDRLKRKLQAERIGVLIDNLETALDSAGRFIEAHRSYVELLRVLADPTVQSITLITTRERLREPAVSVQHYSLKSLDISAWKQFFQNRNLSANSPTLTALHNAYGGNAKAMDIVSGAIQEDFSGDIEAYWQANQDDLFIERDLEDLVKKQFDRLQDLDLDAYNLLCRMGCYRYQDVPTVPIEGLFCLLWDVPENRHRRVIKSLQDRSLVDFEHEKFWLHPVVREEAANRLRNSSSWEKANKNAAEFWNDSVKKIKTVKDTLKAFEAYHHFWEIKAIGEACSVFLKRRPNNLELNLTLGSVMYRMGQYQPIILEIPKIIQNSKDVFDPISLNRLYHYLANANFSIGNIKSAIEHQEKASALLEIATKTEFQNSTLLNSTTKIELQNEDFDIYIKKRKIQSLLSIGIYKIDLWELKEAATLFDKVRDYAQEISSNHSLIKAWSFSGFTKACLGFTEEANILAGKAYESIIKEKAFDSGWFNYYLNILGKTYKVLDNLPKAFKIYNQSLLVDDGNTHTRAKIIGGIAEISRVKQYYKIAVSQYLEAIDLLTGIGVKCDLAEIYFQLALTYQEIGEAEKSNVYFHDAIRLFNEIEAPKQIERVKKSMKNLE